MHVFTVMKFFSDEKKIEVELFEDWHAAEHRLNDMLAGVDTTGWESSYLKDADDNPVKGRMSSPDGSRAIFIEKMDVQKSSHGH